MRPEMLVQCQLACGTSRLVANLPWEKRLRKGVQVTLKDSEDPGQRWTVMSVGHPVPAGAVKHDWHNNI